MSNANLEADYGTLRGAIAFALAEAMKEIHTAMPGLIQRYDPEKKRAVVLPAIQTLLTDGRLLDKPLIANVPVLHPAGGGFIVHLPLRANDPVLLVFSQRGIANFKRAFEKSAPDETPILALKDAIAIPGFGALEFAPAEADALTAQTEDGDAFLSLKRDGEIKIKTAGNLKLEAGAVEIISNSLTHNGRNVGDSHRHSGVRAGSANTGPPT